MAYVEQTRASLRALFKHHHHTTQLHQHDHHEWHNPTYHTLLTILKAVAQQTGYARKELADADDAQTPRARAALLGRLARNVSEELGVSLRLVPEEALARREPRATHEFLQLFILSASTHISSRAASPVEPALTPRAEPPGSDTVALDARAVPASVTTPLQAAAAAAAAAAPATATPLEGDDAAASWVCESASCS